LADRSIVASIIDDEMVGDIRPVSFAHMESSIVLHISGVRSGMVDDDITPPHLPPVVVDSPPEHSDERKEHRTSEEPSANLFS